MKKTAQILVAVLYIFMTMGIHISTHYCGSYAVDVELYSSDYTSEPSDCCGELCESSCCTTQIQKFQIQDLHQATSRFVHTYIQIADFIQPIFTSEYCNRQTSLQHYLINSHPPPSTKTSIINCTFRI